MALSTKELRQRITGVTNIQKITRAMEMVATTKLRRLQQRAEGTRPYADSIVKLSGHLASSTPLGSSPLTEQRDEVRKYGLLVVGSDRGLCGPHNANLFRRASNYVDTRPNDALELYTLGRKTVQHYHRRLPIRFSYEDVVEKLTYRRAREITHDLTDAFLNEDPEQRCDEIWIIYTRFLSVAKQTPVVEKLLPIDKDALGEGDGDGASEALADVILEPSPEDLLRRLLPKSLEVRIFAAILDSLASEFAARRGAMKAATDAAGDMIQSLRRKYNRARQESITTELLDIIGGAEALN